MTDTATPSIAAVGSELPIPSTPSETISLSSEIVMLSDPQGPAAESIRQLRTRIIAQHLDRGRRALALCSPTVGSGCSFVATNLAVAFSQIGPRVLLLNADLRHGGCDRYFGDLGKSSGLLQHLETDSHASTMGTQVLPSLSIVPSGGTSSNPQELLSTPRFQALLNETVREFDLVLIDTPPANLFADALRVARVAGCCAIVARSDKTYFHDVSELARQLRADGVTIVGTILNQF